MSEFLSDFPVALPEEIGISPSIPMLVEERLQVMRCPWSINVKSFASEKRMNRLKADLPESQTEIRIHVSHRLSK